MLDIAFNNFTTDKKYGAGFFKEIIQKALGKLGFKEKSVELSINLVGEGRIKALNKKYRGKNRATDVLSFPLYSGVKLRKQVSKPTNKKGRFELARGAEPRTEGPMHDIRFWPSGARGGIMSLGDIFICLPIAKKSASKENRDLSSELALLTVHGLLHLLGYNHEKSAKEVKKCASYKKRF